MYTFAKWKVTKSQKWEKATKTAQIIHIKRTGILDKMKKEDKKLIFITRKVV